ncbi:MAG: hypothetical protein [Circular genetic element sp.]|nr:MAG: hypothetical protein [Circular genetic element sp.]
MVRHAQFAIGRLHNKHIQHKRSPECASKRGLCRPQLSHSIRITYVGVSSAMFYPKHHYYINAYVRIMHIGGSISAPGKPLWGPTWI